MFEVGDQIQLIHSEDPSGIWNLVHITEKDFKFERNNCKGVYLIINKEQIVTLTFKYINGRNKRFKKRLNNLIDEN